MLNTAQYEDLLKRQEAIKVDMQTVALAVQKIDNGAGKAILAQIGSVALGALGIPIQIPKQFGYASLGAIGIIFSIRDENKLKKYYRRLAELEKEYNENTEIINKMESDGSLTLQKAIEESQARSANVADNTQKYITYGVIAFVAYLLIKRYR